MLKVRSKLLLLFVLFSEPFFYSKKRGFLLGVFCFWLFLKVHAWMWTLMLSKLPRLSFLVSLKFCWKWTFIMTFFKIRCRGGWSTQPHRAKTRDTAAVSRRFLEYLSVICAKRNFKSSSTFIWRKFFCKGPSDLWKRPQKKPFSNKFRCWNM